MQLKCLLLDDELPGLTYLRMLCEQIEGVEVVKAFNDPMRLLEESGSLEFDCCILDIEMPRMNGLQLAQLLRDKEVIFVTAYREYAPEAFDLDAVDYVRKPVQKERLEKALLKASERRGRKGQREYLSVNSEKGKTNINISGIACITVAENDRRDKLVTLTGGQTILLKNIGFADLLEKLPGDRFYRISKSALVSIRHVRYYTNEDLVLEMEDAANPVTLHIGEHYKAGFLEAMKR